MAKPCPQDNVLSWIFILIHEYKLELPEHVSQSFSSLLIQNKAPFDQSPYVRLNTALAYGFGIGTKQNGKKALELLEGFSNEERANLGGAPEYFLHYFLANEMGIGKDEEKAREYMRVSFERGELKSQVLYARYLEKKDVIQSNTLLRKVALQGHLKACQGVIDVYRQFNRIHQSRPFLQILAKDDDRKAQYEFWCHSEESEKEQAVIWLLRAAENGLQNAIIAVADLYEQKLYRLDNEREQLKWFLRAAEISKDEWYAFRAAQLSEMLESGEGADRRQEKYYRMAMKKGIKRKDVISPYSSAFAALCILYRGGRGLPLHPVEEHPHENLSLEGMRARFYNALNMIFDLVDTACKTIQEPSQEAIDLVTNLKERLKNYDILAEPSWTEQVDNLIMSLIQLSTLEESSEKTTALVVEVNSGSGRQEVSPILRQTESSLKELLYF